MQSMTNTLTLLTLSACLGACVPGAPEILYFYLSLFI